MNELVSVVVPMYNVEKKLDRCLNALKKQTYKNIEVILVNDGSPDNLEQICLKYIDDSRFNYYKKNNGGLSSARNYGIFQAKGKYIYFIDSDDYCEINLIEDLVKSMQLGVQISACGYYIEYPNNDFKLNKEVTSTGVIDCSDFLMKLDNNGMFNVVWNKMYDLQTIKDNEILFEEQAMPGEDLVFNCKYLQCINKAAICNKKLYHYMREDEITLVNKYDKHLKDKINYFILIKDELLKSLNFTEEYYMENISNTVISYTFSCLTNLFRKDCKLKKNEKIKEIREIIDISKKCDFYINTTINNKHISLFIKFIKWDKPMLMFISYSFLFFLRNNLSNIYLKYRKNILKT